MIALSFLLSLSACLLWSGVEGQFSGDLRLVNRDGRTSSTLTAGRLEVYYSSQWGTVCDDNFGPTEATVACRQLGFTDGYLYYDNVGSGSRFTAASSLTRTWFDSLSCSSFDTRLIDCASSIGVEDCSHTEDIILYCLGNGALRLSSSITASSGRVEVYYNGRWGTVCDDSFGLSDAEVACGQLGYSTAFSYGSVGTYGFLQGSGTIWLDNLGCNSFDLMLTECSHNGFGISNCVHSEDVAVCCNSFCSTVIPDFNTITTSITGAAIAGIVIAVLVPLCCIGICITIVVIAVCTGACAAGASSRRRRHTNTTASTTTAAAVATSTGTATTGYTPQAGYTPYPADLGKKELQQYPADAAQPLPYPTDPAYPPQPQPYPTSGYVPPTK